MYHIFKLGKPYDCMFPCKGPLCIVGKLVIGLPLYRSENFCYKYALGSHLFTRICVVPSSILRLHFSDSNCVIVSYCISYKVGWINTLIERSSSCISSPLLKLILIQIIAGSLKQWPFLKNIESWRIWTFCLAYKLISPCQVLLKIVGGDYHIIIAGNTKGSTVLHWGVSKSSLGEWLVSYYVLN